MSFIFASSHLPETRVQRPEDEEEDAVQPMLHSGSVRAFSHLQQPARAQADSSGPLSTRPAIPVGRPHPQGDPEADEDRDTDHTPGPDSDHNEDDAPRAHDEYADDAPWHSPRITAGDLPPQSHDEDAPGPRSADISASRPWKNPASDAGLDGTPPAGRSASRYPDTGSFHQPQDIRDDFHSPSVAGTSAWGKPAAQNHADLTQGLSFEKRGTQETFAMQQYQGEGGGGPSSLQGSQASLRAIAAAQQQAQGFTPQPQGGRPAAQQHALAKAQNPAANPAKKAPAAPESQAVNSENQAQQSYNINDGEQGRKNLKLEDAMKDGKVTYLEATQLDMSGGLAEKILKDRGITPDTADSWAKNQGVDIDDAGFWSNASWNYWRKEYGLEGKSNREVAEFMAAKANAYNARVEVFKAMGGADRDRIKALFALHDLASVATLPLALPSAGSLPWIGGKLATKIGSGAPVMSVLTEAKAILTSGQMKRLIDAHKAGKTMTLIINGRPIQVQPGLPFSGFTNFRNGGFVLSDGAFTSAAELEATIIHELTRLRNSAIFQSGVSAERAAAETEAAASAAQKATTR